MINEIWKEVGEYNTYLVSNTGKVKGLKHRKILKPMPDSKGYLRVRLFKKTGEWKQFRIHRLVGFAFVDGFFEGAIINHIDGNKQNNLSSNLEWVTESENRYHAFRTGLKVNTEKQRQCAANLLRGNNNSGKSILDKKTGQEFKSIKDAAKSIGLARVSLSNMLSGVRKNNTNFIYK